jgi:drug/metabolite transporter (DMT)-like permease
VSFWASLIYLTVFGTILAFGAYVSLVGRIGAERASYSAVVSPVIALGLSVVFEGLAFTNYLILGFLLCLVGNVLTLYKAGEVAEATKPVVT